MSKNKSTSKRSKTSLKAKLTIILILLLISFYVNIILFGKNSFIILTKLREEKKELTQEAIELKNSNQKLQKEFFELKNLEPK
jgi:cell division protein FtsB